MEQQDFKLVLLSAKIGVFYAKVDNNYDDEEKQFIQQYIKNLHDNKITAQEKKQIEAVENEHLTIDSIIKDTEDCIKVYTDEDQKSILHVLSNLISMIIERDNVKTKSEVEAYNQWKKHFNL